MAEHTPTPWHYDRRRKVIARVNAKTPEDIVTINNAMKPADAKFIVLACNNHDRLLAACRKARAFDWKSGEGASVVYEELDSAIAAVEGEST